MKRIILLLLAVSLLGCSPQKRLARLLERYPIQPIVDTLYLPGPIFFKDTIITKYLPGETDSVEILIPVPFDIPDTSIYAFTTLAHATARLEDNRLGLDLVQLDSLFQWKLDSAIREHSDTVMILKEVPYPVIKKAKPFYKNGFFILAGLILVGMILLFLFLFRKR